MIRRFFHSGLVYIFVLFGLNVFVQTYTVGKYANVATDEGVDLYASQLVSNGLVPYKDFFLGHLPLWIYINAWLFQLVGNNLTTFHYTYVVWVSSTIFPIFLSVQVLTKKQFGAIAACVIFLTFPEMVQWDFHFFALRQASLPFLAWGVYCLITKRFPRLTGLLFALFGASLFSNYFVTIMLLASYLWRYSQSHFNNKARYYRTLVATFVLFTAGYWLLVWSIPNSISNIFVFQTSRYFYALGDRLQMILNLLELNWVFFLGN